MCQTNFGARHHERQERESVERESKDIEDDMNVGNRRWEVNLMLKERD